MNNLEIPPKVRLYLYLVFAVIGLGLGAAAVGFSTADVSQPTWLKVAQAVLNFVAAGFGYTAATHVNADGPVYAGEGGAVSVLGVIGIVLIIVALLGLLGVVSLSLTVCVILAIIGLLLLVLDWRGGLRR